MGGVSLPGTDANAVGPVDLMSALDSAPLGVLVLALIQEDEPGEGTQWRSGARRPTLLVGA
jgi:hypothetical protein